MKNRILIVLAMVLLLAGLGTLLYPTFKTATVREQEREEIAAFEEYRATATTPNTPVLPTGEPSQTEDPTGAESAERIFPELWDACVAFNKQLPETQRTSYTADSLRRPSIKVSDYGWEQDAFGYVTIPAAEIEAPIFLGANSSNMSLPATGHGQAPFSSRVSRSFRLGTRFD